MQPTATTLLLGHAPRVATVQHDDGLGIPKHLSRWEGMLSCAFTNPPNPSFFSWRLCLPLPLMRSARPQKAWPRIT